LSAPEGEVDSGDEADKRDEVVPAPGFAEREQRKGGKDHKRDDFLHDLQLSYGKLTESESIGGDGKAIFDEGDQPAGEDRQPHRPIAVLQVAVPGVGHEGVGDHQQHNRAHYMSS
jgi:hypothetical protein